MTRLALALALALAHTGCTASTPETKPMTPSAQTPLELTIDYAADNPTDAEINRRWHVDARGRVTLARNSPDAPLPPMGQIYVVRGDPRPIATLDPAALATLRERVDALTAIDPRHVDAELQGGVWLRIAWQRGDTDRGAVELHGREPDAARAVRDALNAHLDETAAVPPPRAP